MMQANVDFVRYGLKVDTNWEFTIAGEANSASEEFHEILDMTKKIFNITNGFYKPTEIAYNLFVYSEDMPVYELLELDSNYEVKKKPLEEFKRVIHSDDEIFFEDLIQDIKKINIKRGVISSRGISLCKGKTKFILKGIDEYIDRKSRNLYGIAMDDNISDLVPPEDPIKIRISQTRLTEHGLIKNTDPAYYDIHIDTWTDIWFEDSAIGLANRNRLKKVLKNINDSFDVTDVLFVSDSYSSDWLKDAIPNLSE